MKIRLNTKELKENAIKVWHNKYLVATILFLIFIIFLDENSIVSHNRNKRILKELSEQKVIYRKQIETDKEKLEDLNSGPENLEKFAREQYYMSRPDEDIFIVEEK